MSHTYAPLTRAKMLAPCLTVLIALTGACSAEDSVDENLDGILITYEAATDDDGNCTPKRVELAQTVANGLHAIRGDADYQLPTGTTSIPFQAVFKYPNEKGIARSRATTMLNSPGSCAELTISIEVEYCEYFTDNGRKKSACPAIRLEGVDVFKAVRVERSDEKMAM